jgi:hypothetical protein
MALPADRGGWTVQDTAAPVLDRRGGESQVLVGGACAAADLVCLGPVGEREAVRSGLTPEPERGWSPG